MLCYGGYFSSIKFIDAKTKYRNLISWKPYLQNHIRTSLGRPRDVSEGRPQQVGRPHPLELQIRRYGDALVTSAGDVGTGRPLGLQIGHYGDALRTLH